MTEDTLLPFAFPPIQRKKVVAAFDGGRLTSDGGVMLLAAAERHLGIVGKLAALIADPRDPALVTHSLADILRARILAIACGYEDGNDLDHLRGDPGFKLACGRLPDSGDDLCSQPTISRWENAPDEGLTPTEQTSWLGALELEVNRRAGGTAWHASLQAMPQKSVLVEIATELAMSNYINGARLKLEQQHTLVSAALLATAAQAELKQVSSMPTPQMASQ